jgi:hypothetical protein
VLPRVTRLPETMLGPAAPPSAPVPALVPALAVPPSLFALLTVALPARVLLGASLSLVSNQFLNMSCM